MTNFQSFQTGFRFGCKMNFGIFVILSLVIVLTSSVHGASLDQVDDTDLVHLLTGEDNVVTLFTKDNCPDCQILETVVENTKKDLEESVGAVVVKAYNSHLVSIYDPSGEPSLIYFRKGIPLLYHGPINEEEIVRMFIDNREPVVKELSDDNFEHLTQAATGATTGDWFIFFYSADCVFCQRLYAVWEAVGANLRQRLNVARVNRLDAGISTAKRFGIAESPEFILLSKGKIYRYKTKVYSAKSFIDFVEFGHLKQTNPESVPQTPNFMDEMFASRILPLLTNSKLLIIGTGIIAVIILLGIIRNRMTHQSTKVKTNKASKKAK